MFLINILALSDLHIRNNFPYEQINQIITEEKISLIILSGDLTIRGNIEQIKSILQSFNQFDLPIFYIPGNMDTEKAADLSFSNVHPLHGRCRNYSGFNFIGLGGSNKTPFFTPFEMSEKELERILMKAFDSKVNDDPIILISHSPPKDTEADKVSSGRHVGSTTVRKFINEKQPLLIICGHIHESKSISKIDSSICINPGAALQGNAAIIKLEKKDDNKISIESKLISI